MKKLLSILILFFLLAVLIPAAPVEAAPSYDPPATDAAWLCISQGEELYPCPVPNNPMSPYEVGQDNVLRNQAQQFTTLTKAQIQCTPTPDCYNDFDAYYRVEATLVWLSWPGGTTHLSEKIRVFGDHDYESHYSELFECGTSTGGTCHFVSQGIIPASELTQGHISTRVEIQSGSITAYLSYSVYFSLLPFGEDCSSLFLVPSTDTYPIDPVISDPVGPATDEQKRVTTTGAIYMIETDGGPWNDGTNDRYDTAISWDGTTYTDLANVDALCVETEAAHPELMTIYVVAQSNTFYIRVNDSTVSPATFTDNTEVTELDYSFGIALQPYTTCESQFTYDPVEDLQATTTVPGDVTDTYTTDYVYGEWYAVAVVDNSFWNEPGGGPRVDMEFTFFGESGRESPPLGGYMNLTEGSPLVWCTSSDGKIVFVQANELDLHLRVNDQDSNYANNENELSVEIYHATFVRAPEVCESQYAIGDLLEANTVDAKSENGETFAFALGSGDISLDYGLIPGGWYAMETTDGPWGYQGALHSDLAKSYDVAVSTDDTETWTTLAEWDWPECNVRIDGFGHRLVYFQVPDPQDTNGPFEVGVDIDWKVRVDDTAYWINNINFMGWNLYSVTDLVGNGDCSEYILSETPINEGQWVDGKQEDGVFIWYDWDTLPENKLISVVITTSTDEWHEADGDGLPRDDMEISYDNGSTWRDLPVDHDTGLICYTTDGNGDFQFIINTGDGSVTPMLRVNSTSFSNNTGGENFRVYTTGNGLDMWADCMGGFTQNTIIEPHAWIPVKEEQGILITSEYAYPESGGLIPDTTSDPTMYDGTSQGMYVVEIEYGTGPWYDGETEDGHHDAQLSSDGGTTWYDMADRENEAVECVTRDPLHTYYKVLIHVVQGQIWRIRVGDSETETFDDNSGNLAYVLWAAFDHPSVELPIENLPMFSVNGGDVCLAAIVSPGPLTLSEIGDLGNYLAEWLSFVNLSFMRYLAWCDRHTSMFMQMMDMISKREPFATFAELDGMYRDIRSQLDAYNWGSDGEDFSILTKKKGSFIGQMDRYVLAPLDDDNPWAGGPLVTLNDSPANPYSLTCSLAVTDYLGPFLSKSMCFLTDILNQTGMMFFIQLLLDLSTVFLTFSVVYNSAVDTVSVFTGVNLPRIWRQSSNMLQIERLLQGDAGGGPAPGSFEGTVDVEGLSDEQRRSLARLLRRR